MIAKAPSMPLAIPAPPAVVAVLRREGPKLDLRVTHYTIRWFGIPAFSYSVKSYERKPIHASTKCQHRN